MKLSRYNIVADAPNGGVAIYNGTTGAVLQLSAANWADAQAFTEGVPAGPQLTEALAHLIVGGMLVPDDADELSALEAKYVSAKSDYSGLGLTIVASLGCNFACPYCFEEKHPKLITDQTIGHIVRLVSERIESGLRSLHITWFGGEPLLALNQIEQLSGAIIPRLDAAGVGYSADIITNGYLLSRQTCERLAAIRVGSAQVGLDGPPRTHDLLRPLASGRPTFDTILQNLTHAVDFLRVTVRVNVTRQNAPHYQELCTILAEHGLAGKLLVYPGRVTHVTTNAAAPSAVFSVEEVLTKPEFANLERAASDWSAAAGVAGAASLPTPVDVPCTAVREADLVIGPDGRLWKCWNSVGDQRAVVGHIASWPQDTAHPVRYWQDFSPFADAQCRSCIALPVCMGGCAHEALSSDVRLDQCSTFRINHRERVQAFVNDLAAPG